VSHVFVVGSNTAWTVIRVKHEDYWLPTPFASFPFTSPAVRLRVPSHSVSALAVAAAPSQVQDGLKRPIACASRQMNVAERNYSASETEMLALRWAVKHYGCYIYGKSFVVRTHHCPHLRKFAESNSRLLGWSLKLSELDFVVKHRAESKIGHVDALSRHVGAVTLESSLN
jgi:hypothetical protein